MSYFISSMPSPGFSEMPPVSNVTQHHRLGLRGAALVLQHDELRRFDRARRDRQERAHLERLALLLAQHFDLQLPVFGELLRGVREVGRRADVARQVAEIARQVHAAGERGALLRGQLGGLFVAGVHAEDDAFQRARRVVRLALHLRELVGQFAQREDRGAHAPIGRAFEHRQLGQRERDLDDLGAEQRAPGGPHGVAVSFLVEGVLLAETDQQHARRADARHFMQGQRGAGLAVHVAGLDDACQQPLGGGVDLKRGARERLRLEHTDNDAIGFSGQETV
jgi:hypothetical protein